MGILLVIGKVTDKQCNLARSKLRKENLRLRVAYLDPEERYRSDDQFCNDADDELKAKGAHAGRSIDQQIVLNNQRAEELKAEFIKKALEGRNLKDVKAILMPFSSHHNTHDWLWLMEQIKHNVIEYTAHSGESGEDYVV